MCAKARSIEYACRDSQDSVAVNPERLDSLMVNLLGATASVRIIRYISIQKYLLRPHRDTLEARY